MKLPEQHSSSDLSSLCIDSQFLAKMKRLAPTSSMPFSWLSGCRLVDGIPRDVPSSNKIGSTARHLHMLSYLKRSSPSKRPKLLTSWLLLRPFNKTQTLKAFGSLLGRYSKSSAHGSLHACTSNTCSISIAMLNSQVRTPGFHLASYSFTPVNFSGSWNMAFRRVMKG